jgi:hypothetical protein
MAALALATAAPAGAAIEIGTTFDPLTSSCGNMLLQSVSPPNDTYAAPSSGVVTSWSYQASTGPVQIKLKVARQVTTTTFTITGESAVQTAAAASLNTFPTRIPIQAGEVIGLTPVTNGLPCIRSMATGYSYSAYVMGSDVPPGTTATFNAPNPDVQIDIAASIEADGDGDGFGDETQDQCPSTSGPDQGCPSNAFSFGKLKRKKQNGTATLVVIAPGPGSLTLTGKGLVGNRAARAENTSRLAKIVNAAGPVTLKVKTKGKKKRKLNSDGSVKVRARVTFTPTGGKPKVQVRPIKLLKQP